MRTRTIAGGLVPIALVTLSLLGCSGQGGGEAPAPEAREEGATGTITIEVTNQRAEEVSLYAILDRQRRRMGIIRGNNSQTFSVPANGVVQLRLEFRITLGPTCITDFVAAGPGDVVPARIPQNLNQMRAVCR